MANEEEVILLDSEASMHGMRVKIALAEKGVEYEYREEGLKSPILKSHILLQLCPIYRKVPVLPLLIHKGKPICESLPILEYIDLVWNDKDKPPLLPCDDCYGSRSAARYLAHVVDKKIFEFGNIICKEKGKKLEAAKKEFMDALLLLEEHLGDKPYFGGEKLGYLDIALIPFYSWFCDFESIEGHCPKLITWAKRCMEKESVSKSLADPNKVNQFVLKQKKKYGIE